MKRKNLLSGLLAGALVLTSVFVPGVKNVVNAEEYDLSEGLVASFSFDDENLTDSQGGEDASAIVTGLNPYSGRMEYVDGYFKSLKSKGLGDFTVYYCGTVVPLQMNREILYFVPAEQLEEYAVLVTAYNEENPKREFPGEFRAANIEYRYNAEGRPVYYYVDHVEEGGTIEHIPPEPTREGYEFKGWFTDENGTQAWDFSQPIRTGEQESLKLFARWQKQP